jgi:hypothetical protein
VPKLRAPHGEMAYGIVARKKTPYKRATMRISVSRIPRVRRSRNKTTASASDSRRAATATASFLIGNWSRRRETDPGRGWSFAAAYCQPAATDDQAESSGPRNEWAECHAQHKSRRDDDAGRFGRVPDFQIATALAIAPIRETRTRTPR